MIRFEDAGIVYADLGSTNGTVVAGARLVKNVPTPLTDKSGILLGRIELAVSLRAKDAGLRDTGPRKTMAWGHSAGPERPLGEKPSPRAGLDRSRSSGPIATPTPPPREPESPASEPALLRQRQILEAFSEAFVGLRKGYEQFGAEVGVRTINGRSV